MHTLRIVYAFRQSDGRRDRTIPVRVIKLELKGYNTSTYCFWRTKQMKSYTLDVFLSGFARSSSLLPYHYLFERYMVSRMLEVSQALTT